MNMRKVRNDFDKDFAKTLYQLRVNGHKIREIYANPQFNKKGVTMQRISNIINNFIRQSDAGRIAKDE